MAFLLMKLQHAAKTASGAEARKGNVGPAGGREMREFVL
jgi:hypothetical protein